MSSIFLVLTFFKLLGGPLVLQLVYYNYIVENYK